MKYCCSCGTALPDSAAFCCACGKAVETATSPTMTYEQSAVQPKQHRGHVVYPLLSFVSMVLGFFLIYRMISTAITDPAPGRIITHIFLSISCFVVTTLLSSAKRCSQLRGLAITSRVFAIIGLVLFAVAVVILAIIGLVSQAIFS